jgi:homocysteine S-methyltransferase
MWNTDIPDISRRRMTLTEFLRVKSPLMLDSAMGTELQRLGVDTGLPLWSARALMTSPHVVRNIHYFNLLAGADIITTNTFRTNMRALDKAGAGERWEELNLRAIGLALEARERYRSDRPVLIAGGLAPVEDCYSPGLVPDDDALYQEHSMQAGLLARGGVDMLLVETMTDVREAVAAARACSETGMEFAVSFVCGPDNRLLSGAALDEAVDAVSPYGPSALLINCVPADRILAGLCELARCTSAVIGCYANTGDPVQVPESEIKRDFTELDFAGLAPKWRDAGAGIIGGCCGTTPLYIRTMNNVLYPDTGYPDALPQQS